MIHEANNSLNLDLPLIWMKKKKTLKNFLSLSNDLFSLRNWLARRTRIVNGRLHDRAKMARIRQKLEQFQQFLQRNSGLLSVSQRVHRRLWTRHGTDNTSLFLCKIYWNRSSFCRIRAIFALSCKRPFRES